MGQYLREGNGPRKVPGQHAYPPKKSTLNRQTKFWLIFTGATLLLLLAAVPVLGRMIGRAPQVGDCLDVEGRGGKVGFSTDFDIVPCEAPTAAYKVAISGGCDDNTYGVVYTGSRSNRGEVCLTLNAKVGDCFYQEVGFPTGLATKVPCGPSDTYRVTAVIPGKADHDLCGPNVNWLSREPTEQPLALVYPRPPLTICTAAD